MKVATLTTSHNRMADTLLALGDLHQQIGLEGVDLDHFVVDDGSTDGTGEAIKKSFPAVKIVQGDGTLYWAGGMCWGWDYALRSIHFDALIVYNDDIRLYPNAVHLLLKTFYLWQIDSQFQPCVVVGSFRSNKHGGTTYGGLVRDSLWHPLRFVRVDPPSSGYLEVDTLNMNCALISSSAISKVGFLSSYFTHGKADFEYGIKLRKSGGAVIVAAGHIGTCDRNTDEDGLSRSGGLLRAYQSLLSVKREPFRPRLQYYKKHAGILWFIYFLAPYLLEPFRHLQRRFKRTKL